MDHLVREDTEEVAEGVGRPRVDREAGPVAEAVRLGVQAALGLVALEAPAALAGLEVLAAVALEVDPGTVTVLAEGEAKEVSLHQAVGRHHRAVTRVEVVEVQPVSGLKERIGAGPPTRPLWKS